MTDEIDMDEAELLHLAMADYMLTGRDPPPQWREEIVSGGAWRRVCMTGDWHKRIPLYLWIAVKKG